LHKNSVNWEKQVLTDDKRNILADLASNNSFVKLDDLDIQQFGVDIT
jgi:hypothetical protein